MEKEHAEESGRFYRIGTAEERGFTPLSVTAIGAVLLLVAIFGWRAIGGGAGNTPTFTATVPGEVPGADARAEDIGFPETLLTAGDTPLPASTSTDSSLSGLSSIGADVMNQLIGTYVVLKQNGGYTQADGEAVANTLAEYLRAEISPKISTKADLATTNDTSYNRMLVYRADLRESFAPLLENTAAEFEIFALYVDTRDEKYLKQLLTAAARYREAADQTIRVVVPADLASYHLALVNALEEFATTLEQMAGVGDDAFASLALLRTYNSAETRLLNAFNALASAQADKKI